MKISVKEHIVFWVSKALYFFFYVVLPIALVGWQAWLVSYLIVNVTMGITLAIVFQLAHVVEKTSFEEAGVSDKLIDSEWAIHEINTTANFAPKNKVISWFVGGLNFQVEHHLFPRISHVHYPAISKIVKEECARFNLPYHYYPTMTEAVFSHIKVMKQLGRKEFQTPKTAYNPLRKTA
jgi:linoleoyl-CoA desaturase